MKTARFLQPLAVFVSAVPFATAGAQEGDALDISGVLQSPPGYWESLQQGGPLFQALHLLLVAAFIAALFIPARRLPWSWSLALTFVPFALGSLATWLSAHQLAASGTTSWTYHSDLDSELAAVPRPIQLGILLTTFALAYRIICHLAPRKALSPAATSSTAPNFTGRLGAILSNWPILIFGAGLLLSQAPFLYSTVFSMFPRRTSAPVAPLFDPRSFAEGLGGVGVVLLFCGVLIACLESLVRAISRLIRSRK